MEALQARHRKERQDLQSRNTQRRKSATKENRNAILLECDALEHQLHESQRRAVAELSGPLRSAADAILQQEDHRRHDDGVEDSSKGDGDDTSASATSPPARSMRKPNRQRARLARRAAALETQMEEAAEEAARLPDRRESERTHMAVLLQSHHLAEKDVRPDGHCLYSAIADQLVVAGLPLEPTPDGSSTRTSDDEIDHQPDYRKVRRAAADYVRHHPDHFAPFLEEAPDVYAHRIGETAEWGGHLELIAIARSYGVVIQVLQADGPLQSIRPQEATSEDGPTLWLAYYRHRYGLGEHYNSLRPTRKDGAIKADISA